MSDSPSPAPPGLKGRPQLDGKVAIVTGASRGLGRALALSMAECGADLVVSARTVTRRDDIAGSVTETAELVRAMGRRCVAVRADLAQADDIDTLVQAALEAYPRIDILVNNAAAMEPEMYDTIWEMSVESWRYQIDLNLTSYWLMTRAIALHMRERGGGVIVNVTSGRYGPKPTVPNPERHKGGAAYRASKVAITQMTEDLALDFEDCGISIVALHPSRTRTENAVRLLPLGGYAEQGHDVSLPVAVFEHFLTSDVMAQSGSLLFTPVYAAEHHLVAASGSK